MSFVTSNKTSTQVLFKRKISDGHDALKLKTPW